jgi:O-antigen ligase
MIIVLPWWYTFGSAQLKVSAVAPVLAMLGLVGASVTQSRASHSFNLVDLAFAIFITAAALSWAFGGPYTYHSLTSFVLSILPAGFFVVARTLGRRAWPSMVWILVVAGTAASLPLFYEFFVTHRPLFTNGSFYYWNVGLFRPGGAFGGPPQAVAVLSMTTLCGLSLLAISAGWRRLVVWACLFVSLGGIIITFTRAGLIGFALGLVVFVVLWRPAVLGRLLYGVATVSLVFVLVVLPQITSSKWYQEGVNRHGTLADRQGRWRAAWPVIVNSTTHSVVGHGFNSLQVGHPLGLAGQPQADLAAVPILISTSPHSQYVRTLLEQGFLGLAVMLAWLLGSLGKAVGATRRATRDGRALLAGCGAGIVSFVVVSFVDDTLRDPSGLATVALLSGLVAAQAQNLSETARRSRVTLGGNASLPPTARARGPRGHGVGSSEASS